MTCRGRTGSRYGTLPVALSPMPESRCSRPRPATPTASTTPSFDATPDLDLRADGQGQVLLGANPFIKDGRIRFVDASANGTIILRVEHDGQVGYGFLESADFSLEYWRGHRDLGQYSVAVQLF